MTENDEIFEALGDLTAIIDSMNKLIKEQERRIAYLERYAKLRRPTIIEVLGDTFGTGFRAMTGG